MHKLQVNLRLNKKFSLGRLKTWKEKPRQKLGYIYKKKKKKKKTIKSVSIRGFILKFKL